MDRIEAGRSSRKRGYMLSLPKVPREVDGDGTEHLMLQAAPNYQIVTVAERDPDDVASDDELLAKHSGTLTARHSSGRLEAFYYTDVPLNPDQFELGATSWVNTCPQTSLAPGAVMGDRADLIEFSSAPILLLPSNYLEAAEKRAAEHRDVKAAMASQGEVIWTKLNVPFECTTSWPWAVQYNAEFAVVPHGGKPLVHAIGYDTQFGHRRHVYTTFEDFSKLRMHQIVKVPNADGKIVSCGVGEAWLKWQGRRQYVEEVFAPGRELRPNILNLYLGLTVVPREGRWNRYRDFLLSVICAGNRAHFDYLILWLARMLQRPGEPGNVAIVLKGGQGIGKGWFGRTLVKIFGAHGIHIANTRHLTGNFNAHLDAKIFVFLDEAVFAGDPTIRGVLNAFITESHLQIEEKGVNVRTVANTGHVVMATNEDWAVPADVDARRFFVLNVSDAHKQDSRYFAALGAELDAGGLEAMVCDLLNTDLTGFDVFNVPKTDALAEQKLLSLKSVDRWLLNCLHAGAIGSDVWTAAGLGGAKDAAYSDYQRASREAKEYAPRDRATWARLCKATLGDCWNDRRPAGRGARGRQLALSGLATARSAFERHFGHEIEWETDAEPGPIAMRGQPAPAEFFDDE